MFISIADLLQTKVREPLIFKGSRSPAKGVVLLKAARVQIPASPPNAWMIIPVRGYRESGNMETVNPELWKP